jgi:uncharacterized membrane protein
MCFINPPTVELRIKPMLHTELRRSARVPLLLAIAVLAAAVDFFDLGRLSLWYDEVVTMRLARAEGPAALLRLLGEIDATRAPLHPLLLQGWLTLFGPSDLAGRAFSAVCGVATILLVYRIGRDAFGTSTGLWASWLAALSPLLIYYAREARMYAWLVLVTCACWALLLRRAGGAFGERGASAPYPPEEDRWLTPPARRFTSVDQFAYITCLVALAYSHPLGMIMFGTLALASGLFARTFFRTRVRWLAVHATAAAVIVPWVGHYLDHFPEHLSGRLPIKFLLGTPIGFIGGNFITLAGFLVLAGFGVARHIRELPDNDGMSDKSVGPTRDRSVAPVCLLIWLTLPPLVLFIGSLVAQPIFGPARYTLFVAPAYLILVASGLSRLPTIARYPLAAGMAGLSIASILLTVFDPETKGDWRAFAAWMASETGHAPTVIVMSADPTHNVEVETARYYLPDKDTVIGSEAVENRVIAESATVYLVVGSKRGRPVRDVPDHLGPYRFVADRSFPGLAVYRGIRGP